ncbi:LANO_0F01068g1_1 [Lachancea nothofagi CBS 11611]|uniref:LANO_0F01068g1_1 n=1 Tax=Lachancea nothofagi CBS 11611 TaxID=1266666 RepID=A0A1G4K5U9_9SACH|nr:LANO_0F01068g1_1 [Lachancea nothofagi CBS 11611]
MDADKRELEDEASGTQSPEKLKSKFLVPGRGILKQRFAQGDDQRENVTISNIPDSGNSQVQDNLDQNNTTSRISTTRLQSKLDRRVSFAPDVTLHRVDFVPQHPDTFREPRRKPNVNISAKNALSNNSEGIDAANSMESADDGGSAVSLDLVRTQKDPYTPVFDKEVSMEITQLFSKHSARPDSEIKSPEGQEDMEVTKLHREASSQDHGGHIVISATVSGGGIEQDMEFTELQNAAAEHENDRDVTAPGAVPYFPAANEQSNNSTTNSSRSIERDLSDMETTEPLKLLTTTREQGDKLQAISPAEASWQMPQQNLAGQNDREILDIMSSQVVTSTQLRSGSTEQLQPDTEIEKKRSFPEASLKRRKISSDETVRSSSFVGGSTVDDDMDLTMMERLSPINISANLEHEVDMLRGGKSSGLLSLKEKVQNEPNSIALSTFLNAVGMTFPSQEDNFERFTKLAFNVESGEIKWPAVEIYNILYADMPILEISAFCCKELLLRVEKSRRLFQEVEEQVSRNPSPALFKKYFDSTQASRETMNNQIILIRDYSKLQALRVWFEWRSMHLNGIKSVLKENLMVLRIELETISARIDKINTINKKVLEVKQKIIRELHLSKEQLKAPSINPAIPERLRIEILKAELKVEIQNLKENSQIVQRVARVQAEIDEIQHKIAQTQKHISLLSSKVRKTSAFAKHEIPKLEATFRMMQSISGVSLKQYAGARLNIELSDSNIALSLDVKEIDTVDEIDVFLPSSLDALSRELYMRSVQQARHSSQSASQFVAVLLKDSFKVRYLLAEHRRLQLFFPCRTRCSNDGSVSIEIRFFDMIAKKCLFLHLPLSEFVSAVKGEFNKNPQLHANARTSEKPNLEVALAHFRARASPAIPWLKEALFV